MSKILAIKPITTKAGKPQIIVTTVADGQVYVPYGSWVLGKKYSEVLDSYVEGDFQADFYAEGDTLLDGSIFEARNGVKILRDFSASMNPRVSAMLAQLSLRTQSDSMLEAAARFKAAREAKVAVAVAAKLDAAAAAAKAPVSPVNA